MNNIFVEPANQQQLNQLFSDYVADPSAITPADSAYIETIVNKFPYCQALQVAYARCLMNDENKFDKQLTRAALYASDHVILYKLIYHSGNFIKTISETETDSIPENAETSGIETVKNNIVIDAQREEVALSSEVFSAASDNQPNQTTSDENGAPSRENNPAESIPVFEEFSADKVKEEETNAETPEILPEETEKLIITNITSTDFFAFEQQLKDNKTEAQKVAKYNDDKLPYTFLWWLDKTRKEHTETYQPYVSFKLDTTQDIKKKNKDELNHQIIEHIFHLQSPLDMIEDKTSVKTVHFDLKRKEDAIIEKFIEEEPHITPPPPDKIDIENKARRSAEDTNDVVSETLAIIYTDQMLYDKAIDTYKKLSLKFPEKSTYFAVQINELEKKVT